MGRLLGIDPGQRWVGLALTDEIGLIPRPERVVDRQNMNLNEVLKSLLSANEVERILVGYPKPLQTNSNERTTQVDQFIEKYISPLEVPHERVSERYTSNQARSLARERNLDVERLDAVAAALIVDHYLQQRRANRCIDSGGDDR